LGEFLGPEKASELATEAALHALFWEKLDALRNLCERTPVDRQRIQAKICQNITSRIDWMIPSFLEGKTPLTTFETHRLLSLQRFVPWAISESELLGTVKSAFDTASARAISELDREKLGQCAKVWGLASPEAGFQPG
jgi:hypothetical protein